MRVLMIAVISSVFLGGCASNKYSCGTFPNAKCKSVSSVYNETNDGMNDYRKDLFSEEANGSGKKRHKGHKGRQAKTNRIIKNKIVVGPSHRSLNYAYPGDPILSKPRVLRVLFNSWIDENNDLEAGGYVYLKVEEGTWTIDK